MAASAVVIGLWTFLATFAAYAVVWWPEHDMLKSSVPEALRGTALLSLTCATPFAGGWWWFRRVEWYVGADGIAVYRRGRLKRSFGWPEITTLVILPFSTVVRSAACPLGEEITWLDGEDVSWLRAIAKDRLGRRLVT